MKRLIIAAVGLALVVGIVVGAIVGNAFGSSASASTAAQPREDQITFFSDGGGLSGPTDPDYVPVPSLLAVDPGDYPPSSAFRFEGQLFHRPNGGSTTCMRLFDLTTNAAVPGSELCDYPGGEESSFVRLRSGAFSLPTGEHEYTVEWKCACVDGETGAVSSARLIVEWTAPCAVGGIAELPPLASAPGGGGSGMGGATYAVLAGAAAGVLAFAVLATLSVRKRNR
jgi:hypothetical protein